MVAKLGNLVKPASNLLPDQFHAMLDLLPSELPVSPTLPSIYPAMGNRRARVALLTGCVQQTLSPQINWATLRVLAKNGVEVIIPRGQSCCGALALHTGDLESARHLAQNNLRLFLDDFDAVITNAAGCGSTLHEYPMLFRGTEWQDEAIEFSKVVQDISVFLERLGLVDVPPLPEPMKVAYHDACHLAHAQHVTAQPRNLLKRIPNLTLIEIPEGDFCCGSAGSYNIEQPEIAAKLGERKIRNVLSTGAEAVATGNIGCLVQLKVQLGLLSHEKENGDKPIPVWHTIELLDQAYHPSN
jgi:glycolate oxidase iron-sulfur subunit